MTPAAVRKRVRAIADAAGDDERAHALEDQLWMDVLREIADGDHDIHTVQSLAYAALQSRPIKFARWCG